MVLPVFPLFRHAVQAERDSRLRVGKDADAVLELAARVPCCGGGHSDLAIRVPSDLDSLRKISLKVEACMGNADISARIERRCHIMDAVIHERSCCVRLNLCDGRVNFPLGVGCDACRQVAPCICRDAHGQIASRVC